MATVWTRRELLRQTLAITSIARASEAKASEPRVVEITLEARPDWVDLSGLPAYLYTYNGMVPGPTIEARPGDELRVSFRNSLPETSNLHFHGLHVSPSGNADNIMVEVPPGERFEYVIPIPADHPSGTFWYHPHVHGSVARQVSRGLAGALIIRNPDEAMVEIDAAPETTLILQDFDLSASGLPLEPIPMERMNGREGPIVTAAGARSEVLTVPRDGWLRVRLINACSSRFHLLRIDEHPMCLIATDGGYVRTVEARESLLLAPGERAEVMIRGSAAAPREGGYRLLSMPYDRGSMGGGSLGLRGEQATLGRMVYGEAAESAWDLPSRLANIEPLSAAPSVRRTLELGQGMGMTFTINGRAFNPDRIDARVALGAVEDWVFVNPTTMDHPMHIHTNPFQVLDTDGNPQPLWKDTVVVPRGSRIAVRTRFRDYAGLVMYHCHILDHEDLGMMGTAEVRG